MLKFIENIISFFKELNDIADDIKKKDNYAAGQFEILKQIRESIELNYHKFNPSDPMVQIFDGGNHKRHNLLTEKIFKLKSKTEKYQKPILRNHDTKNKRLQLKLEYLIKGSKYGEDFISKVDFISAEIQNHKIQYEEYRKETDIIAKSFNKFSNDYKKIYWKKYKILDRKIVDRKKFTYEDKIQLLELELEIIKLKKNAGIIKNDSSKIFKIENLIDFYKQNKQNFSISSSVETTNNNIELINDKNNESYLKYANSIKKFANKMNITQLVHFTNYKNLQSIINFGLLPRSKFDEIPTNKCINDKLRIDNCLDAVSLSISHPNELMFYKCRINNINENWVVIVLTPDILWNKNCAFCWHNASDNRIKNINIEKRKNYASFRKMFLELDEHLSRDEQNLKNNYTTDVQAEVLVFDKINIKDIEYVVFDDKSLELEFNKNYKNIFTKFHEPNKGFYGTRNYEMNNNKF